MSRQAMERQAEIEKLREENAALRARVEDLERAALPITALPITPIGPLSQKPRTLTKEEFAEMQRVIFGRESGGADEMSAPRETPEEIARAVFDRIRAILFNDDPGHAYMPLLTCAKAREEIADAIRQERRAWVSVAEKMPHVWGWYVHNDDVDSAHPGQRFWCNPTEYQRRFMHPAKGDEPIAGVINLSDVESPSSVSGEEEEGKP